MNLPFPYQKQLQSRYELLRHSLGDKPAMTMIATAEGLKYNDVKKAIKKAESYNKLGDKLKKIEQKRDKRQDRSIKNFTGKVTSKDCDELWAKAVKLRAGNKCEKSGETKLLQAHHIIPRTCWALRYDLENGICLTKAVHLFWAHHDGVAFAKWIATKRDLNYLESKRNNRAKNDYMAIKLYLENEIKKYRK